MDAGLRCGSCRFYVMAVSTRAPGPTGVGRCHRYPPVWVLAGDGVARDVEFPPVEVEQWCGEWRAVTAPAARELRPAGASRRG